MGYQTIGSPHDGNGDNVWNNGLGDPNKDQKISQRGNLLLLSNVPRGLLRQQWQSHILKSSDGIKIHNRPWLYVPSWSYATGRQSRITQGHIGRGQGSNGQWKLFNHKDKLGVKREHYLPLRLENKNELSHKDKKYQALEIAPGTLWIQNEKWFILWQNICTCGFLDLRLPINHHKRFCVTLKRGLLSFLLPLQNLQELSSRDITWLVPGEMLGHSKSALYYSYLKQSWWSLVQVSD